MFDNNLKVNNVKKIAVLRANALGDFIVITPALKALRNAYPQAEIILLGRQWQKDYLLKDRCEVDKVVVVPAMKGIVEENGCSEDKKTTDVFFEAMHEEQFDVAINMQGSGFYSNRFIKRTGAKVTIGAAEENVEKPDCFINYYYYQSELIRFLEIVKLIGAETTDLEPRINVLQKDEEEIEALDLLPRKPFVVLQPCAVDIRRMWPLENYPALADALKQKNIEVVFTGSAKDKNAVDTIIASMESKAINTCGKLSIGGLTALLAKASLVIGADTGPLHLARAVNTPTVGIYWAPNLINWGPVTRTLHRPVVSWN
ncbi:MAG: glycosyltransferase family 9 protein, partial [Ilyomonas sp.]